MRVTLTLLTLLLTAMVSPPVAAGETEEPPAEGKDVSDQAPAEEAGPVGANDAEAATGATDAGEDRGDDVGNYARWTGRLKKDLVAFWGRPHKVKDKGDETVLIYELRVTCDGEITGRTFKTIGHGVVTGSQDPLDTIASDVPQGADRRAGKRVAAQQQVRFFIDDGGVVARHEATKPKTNWDRCRF